MVNQPPQKQSLWRQLADTAIEYRAHLIIGGGATAITNAVHSAWNWWSASDLAAWWTSYAHGIHHCL